MAGIFFDMQHSYIWFMKPILWSLFLFSTVVHAQDSYEVQKPKGHNSLFVTGALGANYSKQTFGNSHLTITPRSSNAYLFQAEYNFQKYEQGIYFSAGLYLSIYQRQYNVVDHIANTTADKSLPLHFYGLPFSANIPIKLAGGFNIINQLSAMPAVSRDFSLARDEYHIDVTIQYALLLNYKLGIIGLRVYRPFTRYRIEPLSNNLFRYTAVMFTAGIRIGKS